MIDVHRLHLADVTPAPNLPWARPTFPVHAYLILHDDGPVLVDSGVGTGSSFIDDLYAPVRYDLDAALDCHGVTVDDIRTVVTSHLHFDHCGQNQRFAGARIFVQAAEIDAAQAAGYTIPEWAFPPRVDLTAIHGDDEIFPGVRVVATPGHTPGHQSVVVDDGAVCRTIVCCQASWNVASFGDAGLGDEGWDQTAGAASLAKLHALNPERVLFSHDWDEWTSDAAG